MPSVGMRRGRNRFWEEDEEFGGKHRRRITFVFQVDFFRKLCEEGGGAHLFRYLEKLLVISRRESRTGPRVTRVDLHPEFLIWRVIFGVMFKWK